MVFGNWKYDCGDKALPCIVRIPLHNMINIQFAQTASW